MADIPDFSEVELKLIRATLKERYGRDIPIEPADAELRVDPADRELTLCPIVYWQVEKCSFILARVSKNHFVGEFFYRVHQHYGPTKRKFDDILDCLVALLKVQEEHEANLKDEAAAARDQ